MIRKTTNKETFKPTYVIDATWCEDIDDFKTAVIMAKLDKAVITSDEFDFAVKSVIKATLDIMEMIDDCICDVNNQMSALCSICEERSKKPWYKRFWGWLTKSKR